MTTPELKNFCRENGVADIIGNIILAGDSAKFNGEPNVLVQMPDKHTAIKFEGLLKAIGYEVESNETLIYIKI